MWGKCRLPSCLPSCTMLVGMYLLSLVYLPILSGCASGHRVPVEERRQPVKSSKQTHAVQRGETLFSIAWRYGLDYKQLARFNNISAPYLIHPGQTLQLRGSTAKKSSPSDSAKKSSASREVPKRDAGNVKPTTVNRVKLAWTWPIEGKVIRPFSTGGKSGKVNKGIDLEGNIGDSVRATLSGKVVYAGSGLTGYGKLIILKHDSDYLSAYAHNRKLLVKEGQTVRVGEKIAELGSTEAESPRLHFEIRREGKPVNPLTLLPKRR